MTDHYIELGRLIESENGKFMVVEGNGAASGNYYLISVTKGELIGQSDNINSLRGYIGVIKSITRI